MSNEPTIPAEVEQVRRELAGRGATRSRRPAVRARGPPVARPHPHRAHPFFGVYALVDGASALVPGLRTSDRGARKWLPLSEGAVGVVAGTVALIWPGMTVRGLLYVMVVWAVVTGVLKILTAVTFRREVESRRPLVLGGPLSVLFGVTLSVVLAVLSGSDLPTLAGLVGALAVVVGLAMITLALRFRDRRN